ncbi:MAG: bifunctional DNA-formamidopyrimidine glycosylase/DNA-(apurinic or apyrimidinic site) lyase [Pseudomonadales bacterium]|nr:bifunctional DNA-formamidopyrimidine glycosylase/DNA-(apurinic or apyrimidinic site) lyase [Pseudomonadales bacterium]
MPELPEVETTRRGIAPHIEQMTVCSVLVRQRQLRWPVTAELEKELTAQTIMQVQRRGKYLLLLSGAGTVLIHLGMSGSLRLAGRQEPPGRHDHVDFVFSKGQILRFHDPRKFGCILWLRGEPLLHPLLAGLGPEPLEEGFSVDYLFEHSRKRSAPVKSFIMDSHVVVGVGNIYANEALFAAGIHPLTKAGRISRRRYERLVSAIKTILVQAIRQGGTTLRDFVGGDGKPGYFKQSLAVYGRGGQACSACGSVLREIRLGQRATVYCGRCQRP